MGEGVVKKLHTYANYWTYKNHVTRNLKLLNLLPNYKPKEKSGYPNLRLYENRIT